MNPDLKAALDAIDDLRTVVGYLAVTLLPGTHKPWREPTISAERRAELDAKARDEMRERTGIAPGESPAPLDLEVMDELVSILTAVDALAEYVAVCAVVKPPSPASSAFESPERFLAFIVTHLPAAQRLVGSSTVTVEKRCDDLAEHAKQMLGLMVDGQVLKALCPWCDGRSTEQGAPNGGAHTLKVRLPPHGDLPPVVVCEGDNCDPPDRECGKRYRGRPAWPDHEWGWLAKAIDKAAERRGDDDERHTA